ncbi:MAG TPA: chemotaxis protein CheW, partial [Pseudomonas sp.]|nr:chemotaxis protein CheW [Pseudomonas sp.]
MSQAVATQDSVGSLTGLLVPLADRTLLLPNVAVAELIPYRAPQVSAGMPD